MQRVSFPASTGAHFMAMPSEEAFDTLMDRLRSGNNQVAADVFNLFARRILALARRHLHLELRRKVDPEDVLQSVFRSFFLRQRSGQFAIENWENLWGILMVMTLRKCSRQFEHYHAARRDVRRERSLPAREEAQAVLNLAGAEPAPAEVAVLVDLVERLLRGLPDLDRVVVSLHLQGYTANEISTRVGWATRTIRRVLERVRKRLQRLEEEQVAP
jgi:RNA polymerase sigma factor (sigma-70 family)